MDYLTWDPQIGEYVLDVPPRLRLTSALPDAPHDFLSAYAAWIYARRHLDFESAHEQFAIVRPGVWVLCEVCRPNRRYWSRYSYSHRISARHIAGEHHLDPGAFARYLRHSYRVHRTMAALEGVRLLPRRRP